MIELGGVMTGNYDAYRAGIEQMTDEAFYSVEPPHPLVDISVWHLFTVAEDQLRMFYAGWLKTKQMNLSFVDEYKYSLRHSIAHVLKRASNDKIALPKKTNPEAYEKASLLLEAGKKYESLCRLIASTYNSRGKFIKIEGGYELKYDDSVDIRYSVLEALGHGADITPDITGVLHNWLTSEAPKASEASLILSRVENSVRVRNKRVDYEYDAITAYGITQQLPQREEVIPDNFEFPWGKSFKTHALINALLVRCFYHIFAVQIAARKFGLKGGAESSLVLVISRDQLCEDLQQLADFADDEVYRFIDMLTYGEKSKTPDPALQPLYLSKSNMFMIPCLHILNSNVQRNILSLMAKTEPKVFDAQSSCFEEHMVSNIKPSLENWDYYTLNQEFKFNKKKEEIDGLIVDEVSKTILLLEFRWILQPGDAREVYNKIKSTSSKVDQLNRKISFVEDNLAELVSRAFENSIHIKQSSDWKVQGLVVIQGFGGTVSHEADIPVITLDVLKKGLKKINSLQRLYEWAKGLSWLPTEGRHFEVDVAYEDNGKVGVSRLAAKPLVNQLQYTANLQQNISSFAT